MQLTLLAPEPLGKQLQPLKRIMARTRGATETAAARDLRHTFMSETFTMLVVAVLFMFFSEVC